MSDLDHLLRDAGARLRDTAPSPDSTEAALTGLGDVRLDHRAAGGRRHRWVLPTALAAAVAAAAIGVVVVSGPAEDAVVTPATEPSTTPAPTVPVTTLLPPTTVAVGAGWTAFEGGQFDGLLPCCGEDRIGSPSPALTAAPAALADGMYAFSVDEWSPADPARLVVTVRPFVTCVEGVEDCTPEGRTDELGLGAEARTLELSLDPSTSVVLTGTDRTATADGPTFVALLGSLAAAYDEHIAGPLTAGVPVTEVVADLQANPRGGFTSAAASMMGDLYFSDGNGPTVLLQSVAVQGEPLERSGTSALLPVAVEVVDGQPTLAFHAGMRS